MVSTVFSLSSGKNGCIFSIEYFPVLPFFLLLAGGLLIKREYEGKR